MIIMVVNVEMDKICGEYTWIFLYRILNPSDWNHIKRMYNELIYRGYDCDGLVVVYNKYGIYLKMYNGKTLYENMSFSIAHHMV